MEDVWRIIKPLTDAEPRIGEALPELQTAAKYVGNNMLRRVKDKILEIEKMKTFQVPKHLSDALDNMLSKLVRIVKPNQ